MLGAVPVGQLYQFLLQPIVDKYEVIPSAVADCRRKIVVVADYLTDNLAGGTRLGAR